MVIEKEKSEKHAFFKNSRECCRFQTGTYIFENLSRNKSMQNCHLSLLVLARDSAVPIVHSKSTVVRTGHRRWKTEPTIHRTRMTVPMTVRRKRKRKRKRLINRLPTRRGGRSMMPSSAGSTAHTNPKPQHKSICSISPGAESPHDKNDSTEDCWKEEKEEASNQSFADATRREVHDTIFCRRNGTCKSKSHRASGANSTEDNSKVEEASNATTNSDSNLVEEASDQSFAINRVPTRQPTATRTSCVE